MKGRKPKQSRVPRPVPPQAIERDYLRFMRELSANLSAIYRRLLLPRLPELVRSADVSHRTDAYTDTLDEIIGFILQSIGVVSDQPAVKNQARAIFERINVHSAAQVDNQVKAIAGVSIPSVLPGGAEQEANFVATNVSLVKSIAQQQHTQVESVVREGLRVGTRPEELAESIEERFAVTESRAEFIARDQVLKVYGQVTEARHKSLGLTRFIWRTSGDERVRGRPGGKYPKAAHDHWALEGQTFEYGSAPYGGPGRDFQCRCTAEPDVSDLLDD